MINKIEIKEYITQHTAFVMLPYSMKCLTLQKMKNMKNVGKNIILVLLLATFMLCLFSSRTKICYLLM